MTDPDAPAAAGAFPDLAGRRILLTGASSGIGAAAARAFAAAGARVALQYNSGRAAAEEIVAGIVAAGGTAAAFQADLSRPDAAGTLFSAAVDWLGGLDTLVNNAGGLGGRCTVDRYDEAFVDALLALNVTQLVRLTTLASQRLIMQGTGGSIINVTSIAARSGGGAGTTIYSATKGFVSTATRGWAKELAPHGIRVNGVSPGVIATPLHDRHTSAEQMEAMRRAIPLARIGTPEDCAPTFLFLASEAASGYVTGQILEVNGGQMMP